MYFKSLVLVGLILKIHFHECNVNVLIVLLHKLLARVQCLLRACMHIQYVCMYPVGIGDEQKTEKGKEDLHKDQKAEVWWIIE